MNSTGLWWFGVGLNTEVVLSWTMGFGGRKPRLGKILVMVQKKRRFNVRVLGDWVWKRF